MHRLAPILPLLAINLVIVGGVLAGWRTHRAMRAKGVKAIEAEIVRRGETPVAIESVPLRSLMERTGLSGAHVFRVTTRTAQGEEAVHMWAYDVGMFTDRGHALKRLSHGVWIALA
jgi:hypothetical protein